MNPTGPPGDDPVDTVGGLVASVSQRLHSESEARWIVAQAAAVAPHRLLTAVDRPVTAATVELPATLIWALAIG